MVVMAGDMLIIGMGYTGRRLAETLRGHGWRVTGIRREAGSADVIAFDDNEAVVAALAQASHILSSVPPDRNGVDQPLQKYGTPIAAAPASWCGYLSATGVYGDTGGAWVDESGPVGAGRRAARAQADLDWQAVRPDMRVFRLPGIYGPGRNPLDRIREGRAHRIDLPGQVFSRIHVDDIISAIMKSFEAPGGVYNITDDRPCGQNEVIEYGCALLGVEPPPVMALDEAGLSPQARAFYAENRRVANGRAKRLLGWRPLYPDYRTGLAACLKEDGRAA